jgi:hypothetical protein
VRQLDHDFEERLRALDDDGRACAVAAYTWLALDTRVGGDEALLSLFNEHAGIWNAVRASLVVATISALGRIYDDDRKTNSARQLLKRAVANPVLFTRDALRARRVRGGMAPAAAEAFVAAAEVFVAGTNAFEIVRTDLAALDDAFEAQSLIYLAKVRPIRHKVYAHTGRITRDERDALFTGLPPVRDFERLVVFPLRLHRALFSLYTDGRRAILDDVPTVIDNVLAAPVPPRTSTWAEHRHAAADVARFLDWLLDSRRRPAQ